MKICKIEECESTDLASRSAMCKTHQNEYNRERYRANPAPAIQRAARNKAKTYAKHRAELQEYLRTHPCVDCGHDDIEVLQFDHRERELKDTEVSRLLTGSSARLWAEVAKCDVRCANCHIKRTRRQMGQWFNGGFQAETAYAYVTAGDATVSIVD